MSHRAEALVAVEEQVQVLMRRIKRVIGERAAEVHPDLLPSTYMILGWLAEHGPARGSSLVCQFHIDKGAISRQVQHLVELGLVDRTADPEDRRATLLSASAEARRRLEETGAARRKIWDDQLVSWTPEELGEFAEQLRRFNGALDD
jgi:DNA-binding MarR family transcriptional regulator